MFLHIFVQLVLRVLGGLIDIAALGDQFRFRLHDRNEQAVELVVVKFLRFDLAALYRPGHVKRLRLGVVQFLELGVLAALVLLVDLFQLIGERADQAARSRERVRHGRALAVEQIDLSADFLVLGSSGVGGGLHVGH